MKIIRSADNPQFKALLRLVQSSRERRRSGLSVLDGVHLVATYRDHVGLPERIVVSGSGAADPGIGTLLGRMEKIEPLVLSDGLFRELSSVATPTGIIALVRTPRARFVAEEIEACVMVEDVQDPGNLGSLLRSAAAAGIADVLLSQHSVQAWSPRVLRAGMGAHFLLRIHEDTDLPEAARRFRGRVVAASQRAAKPVFDADLTGNVALAFGNEGSGLSAALLDAAHETVAIPMPGKAESLNVAAAAAVCLFERVRQLQAGRQLSAVSSRPEPRGGSS